MPFTFNWMWGDSLVRYSIFSNGCLLALTNTLAAFSIAPIVNFFAIFYGGLLGGIFAFFGFAFLAYAFDTAYVESRDNNSAVGASIFRDIKNDALKWATIGLSVYSVVRPVAEAYLYAYVDDSPAWYQQGWAEEIN